MPRICENCGKEIKSLPFKCKRCNKVLCVDCRLPEQHECKTIKRSWEEYAEYQKKFKTSSINNKMVPFNPIYAKFPIKYIIYDINKVINGIAISPLNVFYSGEQAHEYARQMNEDLDTMVVKINEIDNKIIDRYNYVLVHGKLKIIHCKDN